MTRGTAKRKVLLVEGRDEEAFFAALLETLGLPEIEVRAIGGKSRLSDRLKVLVQDPFAVPVESMGIVQDADRDPQAAFQGICSALAAAGLPIPAAPGQFVGTKPRIAVLIVPGSTTPGMLEDLCLASVRDDPAMACVDGYFTCLKEETPARSQNLAKARVRAFLAGMEWLEELHYAGLQDQFATVSVQLPTSASTLHAFLASRYKPDLRLGTAAQAGYWPLDDQAFEPLCDFLRRL